ncbi:MAG: acyl-CoA thioesterase [Alicyclobacillus sp.]|nr:acyl-CoA thioesterase [Alicyclobacillus sp.]
MGDGTVNVQDSLVSTIEITVRSTEIDVNGHVNNAKYLEYLEWGREDWYEQRGFTYEVLRDAGYITVLVHIGVDYRREAFQNDRLRIQTHLSAVGNSSITMRQIIDNQSGGRVVDAEAVIVTIDPVTRKPVPVPDSIRRLLASS